MALSWDCCAAMAVEEQICTTASAPQNHHGVNTGDAALVVKEVTANGHGPNGDVAGVDFGELDDLETVDVTGGALPEAVVNSHCLPTIPLDCDPVPTLREDLLPDLTEPSAHLSASATPDKAREIDIITQRIGVLHEHLQKSNVSCPPSLLQCAFLAARILECVCCAFLTIAICTPSSLHTI